MTDHHDDLTLDIFPDFDPAEFAAAEQRADVERRAAVAFRTQAKIHARRTTSEAHLAAVLPAVIEPGDAWHVLSSGDVDSLSYLAHLLKATPMAYVAFSTWCMAEEDVKRIRAWLGTGTIGRVDAYVGEIFPNQYADEYAALRDGVRPFGGRVCTFRNHSKLFLCAAADGRRWVVESSANINTNPRTENTVITADAGLFAHHLAYLDGVRSFNRDFDTWTPWQPTNR